MILDKKTVANIFDRLKTYLNAKSDADLARSLQIKPQGLNQHKQKGTIPFIKIIEASVEHNFSLDDCIFGTDTKKPLQQHSELINDLLLIQEKASDLERRQVNGLIRETAKDIKERSKPIEPGDRFQERDTVSEEETKLDKRASRKKRATATDI